MNTSVILEDLVAALEWVSAGESAAMDSAAYVSKAAGKVHWSGEGVDEELPPSIEDATLYVAVPGKSELGLGRSLALRFAQDHFTEQTESVHQIFSKRGAYPRFKSLLDRAGLFEVGMPTRPAPLKTHWGNGVRSTASFARAGLMIAASNSGSKYSLLSRSLACCSYAAATKARSKRTSSSHSVLQRNGKLSHEHTKRNL